MSGSLFMLVISSTFVILRDTLNRKARYRKTNR